MQRPLTAAALSRLIKEEGYGVGFDKVGIVKAEVLANECERLKDWLDRGYHGGMNWMAHDPDKRANPKAMFPEANSVVVTALNYYRPEQHSSDFGLGKVSRHAWGDDYHEIVRGKLQSLLSRIKAVLPKTEGKVSVDIQPTMDKVWAARAGLGWIGKHSNLITQEFGSWVFVGELFLNLELEYDTDKIEDHCGSCTLCIDACPTSAITEPYVIDSNKCISYATIELREPEMSADIAANLDGWFYGCDICQDVCPWNRFEQNSRETGFQPRPENVNVSLTNILELTPDSYANRFRHSAMKRAKLWGLQRNARALLRHGDDVAPASGNHNQIKTRINR